MVSRIRMREQMAKWAKEQELEDAVAEYCKVHPGVCNGGDTAYYKDIADNILDFYNKRNAAHPPPSGEELRRHIHGHWMKPLKITRISDKETNKKRRGRQSTSKERRSRIRKTRRNF